MKIVALCFLALLGCAPAPVTVAETPPVVALPMFPLWDGGADARAKGYRVIEVADAAAFIAAWDAIPPVSRTNAERVFLVEKSGSPTSIIFVRGEFIVGMGELPPHIARNLAGTAV